MSRNDDPPPGSTAVPKRQIIDPETARRLQEVRYKLWEGSFKGAVVGGVTGYVAHAIVKFIPPLAEKFKHPKYATGFILFPMVFFSYIGASVSGRNAREYISDIYLKGAKPKSEYGKQMLANQLEVLENADDAYARRQKAIDAAKAARDSPPPGPSF